MAKKPQYEKPEAIQEPDVAADEGLIVLAVPRDTTGIGIPDAAGVVTQYAVKDGRIAVHPKHLAAALNANCTYPKE